MRKCQERRNIYSYLHTSSLVAMYKILKPRVYHPQPSSAHDSTIYLDSFLCPGSAHKQHITPPDKTLLSSFFPMHASRHSACSGLYTPKRPLLNPSISSSIPPFPLAPSSTYIIFVRLSSPIFSIYFNHFSIYLTGSRW